jgi:hypothetical protein
MGALEGENFDKGLGGEGGGGWAVPGELISKISWEVGLRAGNLIFVSGFPASVVSP